MCPSQRVISPMRRRFSRALASDDAGDAGEMHPSAAPFTSSTLRAFTLRSASRVGMPADLSSPPTTRPPSCPPRAISRSRGGHDAHNLLLSRAVHVVIHGARRRHLESARRRVAPRARVVDRCDLSPRSRCDLGAISARSRRTFGARSARARRELGASSARAWRELGDYGVLSARSTSAISARSRRDEISREFDAISARSVSARPFDHIT